MLLIAQALRVVKQKRSHIRLLTAADPIRKPPQPLLTFPLSCVCFDHRSREHNQRQAWMFAATALCTAKRNHHFLGARLLAGDCLLLDFCFFDALVGFSELVLALPRGSGFLRVICPRTSLPVIRYGILLAVK
jgi:hypothetical protein